MVGVLSLLRMNGIGAPPWPLTVSASVRLPVADGGALAGVESTCCGDGEDVVERGAVEGEPCPVPLALPTTLTGASVGAEMRYVVLPCRREELRCRWSR